MKKTIETYKEELIEKITKQISEEGSVPTFIQVYASRKDEEKPVIVHIEAQFESKEDKIYFVEEGIPQICKKLKGEELKPIFVAFVAEAYMTVTDKKTEKSEKREILMVNISNEDENKHYIFNMIRGNYEVDANGDLKEDVKLEYDEEISEKGEDTKSGGIFSGMFDKFVEGLK